MEQADTRTKLLIGEEGAAVLKARTVCVLGIGGVGSFCVEALARSGIGRLILVDGDVVAPSNLNRQLMAVQETIGKAKTEAMAERIRQYRSDIEIRCVNRFYDASLNEELFCEPIDFVVDAIDTLSSKRDCIEYCLLHQIPFISSMGMANRLDPTKLTIMELMKTTYDPLAKVMRSMMRKSVVKGKIPVVCSLEQPIRQTRIINEDGKTRKEQMPPASSSFVKSYEACIHHQFTERREKKKTADGGDPSAVSRGRSGDRSDRSSRTCQAAGAAIRFRGHYAAHLCLRR